MSTHNDNTLKVHYKIFLLSTKILQETILTSSLHMNGIETHIYSGTCQLFRGQKSLFINIVLTEYRVIIHTSKHYQAVYCVLSDNRSEKKIVEAYDKNTSRFAVKQATWDKSKIYTLKSGNTFNLKLKIIK